MFLLVMQIVDHLDTEISCWRIPKNVQLVIIIYSQDKIFIVHGYQNGSFLWCI